MTSRVRHLFVLSLSSMMLAVNVSLIEAQTPSFTEPTSPQYAHYKELVQKVKSGDASVNFVELIAAASDWELAEKKLFTAPKRDAMVEAFKSKNYKDAVGLAETVLDFEFTNRELHAATANAYKELHDDAKAELHRNLAKKNSKCPVEHWGWENS